jgi:hypothetical protein
VLGVGVNEMTIPKLNPTTVAPLRLYLDETGDHSCCTDAKALIGTRYLGLMGVIFQRNESYSSFVKELEALKARYFKYDPDEPMALHRTAIINRNYPFDALRDNIKRAAFDKDLLELIGGARCRMIAVVVDKYSHGAATYRELKHPYHYGVHALMERYAGLMDRRNHRGDVMAEGRGGAEDTHLKAVFKGVFTGGTKYLKPDIATRVLTSGEIKIKTKKTNQAGLQLADVLAHTATRMVLREEGIDCDLGGLFAEKIAGLIEPKFNRNFTTGRVRGYGRVLLK